MLSKLPKLSILFAFFANAMVIMYASLTSESNIDFWQSAARFTARISFLIFILMFVARVKGLFSFRSENNLFVAFLISHLIHLGALWYYNELLGGLEFNPRIYGGMAAYVLIIVTPVFGIIPVLTDKYLNLLRWLTVSVLWLVMFLSYLPRVMNKAIQVGGERHEFIIGLCIVVFLGIWGIVTRILNKNKS